jgi:hypothetical protein
MKYLLAIAAIRRQDGRSEGNRPGQTLGTGIEGGVSHHLTKGDVITIPAKIPRQWKDTSKTGSVGYYAVNFDSN